MKDMLTNAYKVQVMRSGWHYKTSRFAYGYVPALKHRFISVCNNIIDEIALRGHIAISTQIMTFDNEIYIEERTKSGRLIRIFRISLVKEE